MEHQTGPYSQQGGAGAADDRPLQDPQAVLTPPPPPPGFPPPYYPPPPPPRRTGMLSRVLGGLVASVLLFSIALNVWLGAYFTSSMQMGPHETTYSSGDAANRIVILPVRGTIDSDTSRYVRDTLQYLRAQAGAPKALVLRIESPGGAVSPSDRIWHDLTTYKQETGIPIVASYGDVAASGGYYISCMADHIVSEPTAITGSIGVLFVTFTTSELLEKIGVDPTTLTASGSQDKDLANNPFRTWTQEDTKAVQPFLDTVHELFIDRVFAGRSQVVSGLTMEQVRAAATGRAYFTRQAMDLHLVDQEGYLEDAIDKARQLAGLAPGLTPQVNIIRVRGGLLGSLGITHRGPAAALAAGPEQTRSWLLELARPRLEYRWTPGAQP